MKALLFIIAAILAAPSALAADIKLAEGLTDGIKVAAIIFEGSISEGDHKAVKQIYEQIADKEEKLVRLVVSSGGGNVIEAMEIGKLLRQNDIELFVPPGKYCSSACIYLVAGAKKRYILGKLGIHRPYFKVQPDEDINQSLRSILRTSRQYFDEMNIPSGLADEMFSIQPEHVHYLTNKELQYYRLDKNDFAVSEQYMLLLAKHMKVTRQEAMKIVRTVEEECKILTYDPKKYSDCYVARIADYINK